MKKSQDKSFYKEKKVYIDIKDSKSELDIFTASQTTNADFVTAYESQSNIFYENDSHLDILVENTDMTSENEK